MRLSKYRLIFSLFLLTFHSVSYCQQGTVHFQIKDASSGQLTPSRITILKDGNPIDLNVASKQHLATRANMVYTASGTASFKMEKGNYEIWVSKGMEYSIQHFEAKIKPDSNYYFDAELNRVLNTEGFIGGDMHLHTYTNSGHGDANLLERVISCAAEGLEWIVATDHNYITDYRPYMKQAGIVGSMKTAVGNEVSTSIGHFNTYPINPHGNPVNSKPKNGNILFNSIRQDGGKEVLIQVNHPRWVTSDYFNIKGLDPYFGTIPNPEWSWDFDAYEVLNENKGIGWRTAPDNLQSVRRDWYNMLNHNIRKTGLGNSDSHSVIQMIAGVPRNYIRSSTDIPSNINEQEIISNIKNQQVSVAAGIFAQILHNGEAVMGKTLVKINEEIDLSLFVQAASWVDCTKAELIENGHPVYSFNLIQNQGVVRLDTTIKIRPKKDSWYVLVAFGEKPMFPIVGQIDKPIYPLGFTNPVWVDSNQDSKFTSLYTFAEDLIKENGKDIQSLIATTKLHKDLTTPLLFHLFNKNHPQALDIAMELYHVGNTDQKQIIIREIAKIGGKKSMNYLKQLLAHPQIQPLEEISIAAYRYFPIDNDKFENFKNLKNSQLDDCLNFLETKLTYIRSGGISSEIEYGVSVEGNLPEEWDALKIDINGKFQSETEEKSKHHFYRLQLKTFGETNLPFYLHTDHPVSIWINGQEFKKYEPTYKLETKDKIIHLPIQRGNNQIVLQLLKKKKYDLCFLRSSDDLIIDPKLKIEEIDHLAKGKKVSYINEYNFKYHGHGIALTDGYRGTSNFSTQLWQGWLGEPASFIIDLDSVQTIREIKIGALIDQGAWIFAPQHLQYYTSINGKDFDLVFNKKVNASGKAEVQEIKQFIGQFPPTPTRYVKIIATPIDALPEWHNSKGSEAWIFLDEVEVR